MSTIEQRRYALYEPKPDVRLAITAYKGGVAIPLVPSKVIPATITIKVPDEIVALVEAFIVTMAQEDRVEVSVTMMNTERLQKTYRGLTIMAKPRDENNE